MSPHKSAHTSFPVRMRTPSNSSLALSLGQGSTLGEKEKKYGRTKLLFIIFVGDVPLNVPNTSMYIYANGTAQVVARQAIYNFIEVAST